MSKFKIEIQITLISFIIGFVVITSGYLAYKSLTEIVNSIHREALPNNHLFITKNLAADLAMLENNARYFILTNKNENLKQYNQTQQKIDSLLNTLQNLPHKNNEEKILSDSISSLAQNKVELWNQILILHESAQGIEPEFTEIYSKLGEVKLDTIQTEREIKERGFLFFNRKRTITDTTIVEREPDKEVILQELQALEDEIIAKGEEINILESQLIEKNLVLVEKINNLIAEADKKENENLLSKTEDADRLAAITYQRLTAFSVAAVLLLLLVLFVLFNYLRKSRKYQQALKLAKNQAEELAVAKEKFAANVSHELRTPVNAIYGLAEQLVQKSFDEVTREQVSILSKSANHLKNVINDTLDFSKIHANKLKLEKTDFSPSSVFNEVIALQKFEAKKKNNILNFNWTGEKPVAIIGDPFRLKQILINLIGNAIKFTQDGEISLRVETTRTKTNTFNFSIWVIDTGVGIAKENIKIIFDEYVQAEDENGYKYQGTGLGLSIVKKLIELHGGTISVESEPGKGTTIQFEIKYKEGKAENIEKNELEIIEVPDNYKKLRFLIADDTEFNRFLLKGILIKWKANFEEVTDGNKVVEAALSKNFDIIFMDLRMPGKNGFDATIEILQNKPETKIIAISASNEEAEKQKCLDAGMKGFLSKPFSEKSLLRILNQILEVSSNKSNFISPVDIEELKRLSGGDKIFMTEMIEIFIKSSKDNLKTIEKALKYYDWDTIRETTHKMATPYKHMNAMNLYKKIKSMESHAEKKLNIKSIRSLFFEVRDETEAIIDFLDKYLKASE